MIPTKSADPGVGVESANIKTTFDRTNKGIAAFLIILKVNQSCIK
jgi:hypothetical protein